MKVLTATSQTQGWRENDFCWTVEGELVFLHPIECGRGTFDNDCGCRRSMAGLVSHRATTTMKVTERKDLNPDTYFTLVADGLESQRYVTEELMANRRVKEWVHELADELITLAAGWPVGVVVERRGDLIQRRTLGQYRRTTSRQ
jgi:hypothetical protein